MQLAGELRFAVHAGLMAKPMQVMQTLRLRLERSTESSR